MKLERRRKQQEEEEKKLPKGGNGKPRESWAKITGPTVRTQTKSILSLFIHREINIHVFNAAVGPVFSALQ